MPLTKQTNTGVYPAYAVEVTAGGHEFPQGGSSAKTVETKQDSELKTSCRLVHRLKLAMLAERVQRWDFLLCSNPG